MFRLLSGQHQAVYTGSIKGNYVHLISFPYVIFTCRKCNYNIKVLYKVKQLCQIILKMKVKNFDKSQGSRLAGNFVQRLQ